ncbi:putative ORFan [Tupanvirus deep ocean]|uniref:ORFan n=2 Tax=Tupanvirus TaxID=2094720 RepID=A0AC62A855_9VIRU|nr:putative ORFan [Tupanvirus deep ocean]QKU33959.1 putative ORFan [Tupanvirus deep ocean]
MKAMYRTILENFLSFSIDCIYKNSVFDMTESVEKTDNALKEHPEYNSSFLGYTSGNCYYNGKLSVGDKLNTEEKTHTENINKLVMQTKPIDKPLYLFHGFEAGVKYDDTKWMIGDDITFNLHLSKTPAFWVASRFSNHFGWYLEKIKRNVMTTIPKCYDIGYFNAIKTLFYQKYLFCVYNESGKWHHISTDNRCPKDLMIKANEKTKRKLLLNEEFEYLSHTGEKFKLVDIVYKFNLFLPFVSKYYVMVRIE